MYGTDRSRRKTIGLLINQLDGRYQSPLWRGVSDYAQEKDINLIIVPGKALESAVVDEKFHNIIYQLLNPDCFDGLVVASGAIGNAVGRDRMLECLQPYLSKPMVSIAMNLPGIPSVILDNRKSMTELVKHFVEAHHFRKIAFIQGPPTNQEATERFQAYAETMGEYNLPIRPELIYQGDFSVLSGRDAVRQLFGERHAEAEALICANDEMALGAFRELQAMGVKVPEQVAMAGFDDIEELRFTRPAFTTVRQPLYEQGRIAAELLVSRMEGGNPPAVTYVKGNCLIRESCGCVSSSEQVYSLEDVETDHEAARKSDPAVLEGLSAFEKSFDAGFPTDAQDFLNRFSLELEHDDLTEERFLFWRDRLLESYKQLQNKPREELDFYRLRDFFKSALLMLDHAYQNDQVQKRQELQKILWHLRGLVWKISSLYHFSELYRVMREALPELGIGSCALSLYQEPFFWYNRDTALPKLSRLVVATEGKQSLLPNSGELLFQTSEMLPEFVLNKGRRYCAELVPLTIASEQYGVFFCEIGNREEAIYGTLVEQISRTVKSCYLFQEREDTEKKLQVTLDALQKSEERFRKMAVSLPTIIVETDLHLRITFLNQAGAEAFDLKEEEVKNGMSLLNFVHAEDYEKVKDYSSKVMHGDEPYYNEFRLVKRDGTKLTLLSKATPVLRESRLEGIRWSAIDVKPLVSSVITPDDSFFRKYRFSPREKEVLDLVLQGYKNKEIAQKLYIAESTVKDHMGRIYSVIGVKNKTELFDVLKDYQVNRYGHESFLFSLLSKMVRD